MSIVDLSAKKAPPTRYMDTIIFEVDPSQITPAFARNPAGGEYLPFRKDILLCCESFSSPRICRLKKTNCVVGLKFFMPH